MFSSYVHVKIQKKKKHFWRSCSSALATCKERPRSSDSKGPVPTAAPPRLEPGPAWPRPRPGPPGLKALSELPGAPSGVDPGSIMHIDRSPAPCSGSGASALVEDLSSAFATRVRCSCFRNEKQNGFQRLLHQSHVRLSLSFGESMHFRQKPRESIGFENSA